ncbi:hypothetical protein ACS0TY_002341 [Phlomoides rotata]
MGTEKERKKEKDKKKKKVKEEVRVPKWRKEKEVKQGTKEVELDHWGVPNTVVPLPFPQRSNSTLCKVLEELDIEEEED